MPASFDRFRIARDRIYREYRRRKLPMQSLDETNLEEWPETDESPAAADWAELHHCLDAISPEHREALVLRFFEEIARVTGAAVGTVRSRIYYGKRALRTAWEENCYEPKRTN
jgi:RNA polymerase sigma-70 factor, ECF subfamily